MGSTPFPAGTMGSSSQFVCEGSLLNVINVTGGVTDTSVYGFQWESPVLVLPLTLLKHQMLF